MIGVVTDIKSNINDIEAIKRIEAILDRIERSRSTRTQRVLSRASDVICGVLSGLLASTLLMVEQVEETFVYLVGGDTRGLSESLDFPTLVLIILLAASILSLIAIRLKLSKRQR